MRETKDRRTAGAKKQIFWNRYSRKIKVLANGIGFALLLCGLYVMLGCPAFSVEAFYRRAEKSELVGPAEILGIVDTPTMAYEHMLIAKDQEGVILYLYTKLPMGMMDHFVYREKQGEIMVLSGTSRDGTLNRYHTFDLPVVIFHEEERAVSARAKIDIPGRGEGYILETNRGGEGYFLGEIPHPSEPDYAEKKESDYLERLIQCSDSKAMADPALEITIQVWLYNEAGEVIGETIQKLRPVTGEEESGWQKEK